MPQIILRLLPKEYSKHILYAAGSNGHIYSKYTGKWKKLKSFTNNSGYQVVDLYVSPRISIKYLVHRLVALVFISNIENNIEVGHKDENKFNNKPTNLYWTTHIENIKYTYNNRKIGKRTLSDTKKHKIIALRKKGLSYSKLAKRFDSSYGQIWSICNKKER